MTDERFWRHHLSDLGWGDEPYVAPATAPLETPLAHSLERLGSEGWFRDACATLGELAPRIGRAVSKLRATGLPGIFVFLADEPWTCFHALDPMLRAVLGDGYRMMPNFWVWHVDPNRGESGWPPHRDRGRISLSDEGWPTSLTAWVPLSNATPENGCMYVVPKGDDPLYATESENAFSRERGVGLALPARPGEYLCWDQAILHWGGQSSPSAIEPRISMAFEFQRSDRAPFNEPLISPGAPFGFATRLQLVAQQIAQFAHLTGVSPPIVESARRIIGW